MSCDKETANAMLAIDWRIGEDPCPIDPRILMAWDERAIGLGSHSHAELGQMAAWLARRLMACDQQNVELRRAVGELEDRVAALDGIQQ